MSKQLVSGKHRLRNTYWSLVGAASATILSVQPVMAETIWDRFSTIMRDIYGQLVGISTHCRRDRGSHCVVGADGQPEPACGGRGYQLAQTSRCDLDYS